MSAPYLALPVVAASLETDARSCRSIQGVRLRPRRRPATTAPWHSLRITVHDSGRCPISDSPSAVQSTSCALCCRLVLQPGYRRMRCRTDTARQVFTTLFRPLGAECVWALNVRYHPLTTLVSYASGRGVSNLAGVYRLRLLAPTPNNLRVERGVDSAFERRRVPRSPQSNWFAEMRSAVVSGWSRERVREPRGLRVS